MKSEKENNIQLKFYNSTNKTDVKNEQLETGVLAECVIAGMMLKNRTCFINLSDNQFFCKEKISSKWFDFYQKVSRKDVGLIFTGGVICRGQKDIQFLFKDDTKENLKEFVKNIHSSGAKIGLTIKTGYGRANGSNKVIGVFNGSASFNKAYDDSRMVCMRLSDQKINDIVQQIESITKLSKEVGFDCVLIDGGIDGILGELLSKEFNKRVLGYYANVFEVASKFVKFIMKSVGNYPVFFKLNIGTFLKQVYENNIKKIATLDGIKYYTSKKDVIALFDLFVKLGVDGFVLEIGTMETEFLTNAPSNLNDKIVNNYLDNLIADFKTRNIKNKFGEDIKFIISFNENLVQKNDYLFNITKNIYADDNFLLKIKTQKPIKNCIKCNKCIDFIQKYNKIVCTINPDLTSDKQICFINNKNQSIAIIGAGVAGICCALTLADRGFIVDLYEKEDNVNKTNKLCEVFGSDDSLKKYNEYLKIELLKNAKNNRINLKTSYNVEYNTNFVKQYTTIIVATGAREKFFAINGAVQKHVKSIYEILSSNKQIVSVKTIAIYARSELSFKLALLLANQNKKVSLIVKCIDFMFEMPNANLTFYLNAFKQFGVDLNIGAKVKKINEDSADIIVNNKFKNKDYISIILNIKSKRSYGYVAELKTVDADLFIYEPELISNNKLYIDLIKNRFKGNVYLIGDALQVGDLFDAVSSGYYVGKNI